MKHETLKDRIEETLKKRPYWGVQSVAKALGKDPAVIRVTASKSEIRFMDRYEVEAYVDKLVNLLDKRTGGGSGSAE
jgi:uncharacterized protein YqiB (DUF1249 family)